MGLPFDLIWLSIPIYLVFQAILLRRTSGVPKWAAVLPMFVMVPVFAITLINFARESNLWPLPILIATPLAMFYVTAIMIQSCLQRRHRDSAD